MRIALAAGETSGDALAAALARALKAHEADLELAGVTGPAMREAGVRNMQGIEALDMMGLTEVLAHLPRLARLRRSLARRIEHWEARAFVGVDAPDFNLGLARRLRRRGVFTAQFVAPSVWAWRRYRIGRIARSLDLLLTLFPFEPELFQGRDLEAVFVGHPLADELPMETDRAAARRALGLPEAAPVIALLPGSRPGELARHAGLVARTAGLIRQRLPGARTPVLLARPEHRDPFEAACGAGAGLEFVEGRTRAGIEAADVALAASGTVTLEALLLKTPMVVFYRLPPVTYWLARGLRLVTSPFISLPNVLARRALVPERIQAEARPETLADDVLAWLDRPERAENFVAAAREIHAVLRRGAAAKAAEILLDRLSAAR